MSIDASCLLAADDFDLVDSDPLAGVLFAEDFDLHDPSGAGAAAPKPAPKPTPDDVAQAHARGLQEGRDLAAREAELRAHAAQEAASTSLFNALDAADQAARHAADAAAHATASVITQTLGLLLPELCAHHGSAEAASLVRALLPMLAQQPSLIIRANPHSLPALQGMADARPASQHRIRIIATNALPEGDVSIEWQDGAAHRQTTNVLDELRALLNPLIGAAGDPGPAALPRRAEHVKPQPQTELADAR